MSKNVSYTITLNDIHPSLNSWTRMHFHVRNSLKKDWEKMVWAECKAAKVPMIKGRVDIHIDYFGKRYIDLDNLTPKFILDGLKGVVILGDDPQTIRTLSWTFTKDVNKRSVILIKQVGN